jgi:cephalosporin hydroxylase
VTEQEILDEFAKITYATRFWAETRWLGVQAQKFPTDFWVYQEIIWDIKPDIIIECGTAMGGAALFFASICDLIGKGRVFTIDSNVHRRPCQSNHKRITYYVGGTIDKDIIGHIEKKIRSTDVVLVNLDSGHNMQHVLDEMNVWHKFVTPGSYMIVEDSDINGHPVYPEFGPGPYEAIHEFLKTNHDFEIDKKREKFTFTSNPDGFLRKIQYGNFYTRSNY